MPRERTAVAELELSGSHNVKRSLGYKAKPRLAKRETLEAIFQTLEARYAAAMTDLETNGLTIVEDHFDGKKLYQKRVPNPSLKIAQQCEKQLVALAKVLTADNAAAAAPGRKSDEELLALVRSN